MDSRGAAETRACGGAVQHAGLRPAQAPHVDPSHGRRAGAVGQGLDRAHPLAQREPPDIARATWKYLEPKDWLNYRLTGRCVATFDSIVLHWVTDNRDSAHVDYDPDLLRIARPRPRAVARSRSRDRGRRHADGSGGAAARRSHGDRGRGRHAGSAVGGDRLGCSPRLRGSPLRRDVVVVDVSRSVQEDGPFDGSRRCRRRCPASTTWPTSRKWRAAASNGSASTRSRRATTWRASTRCGRGRAGSEGVIFTPWLNGERTPVDDHTLRGGMAQPVTLDDARRPRAVGPRRCRVQQSLAARDSREVRRATVPWLHFIGGGAQSELWCQIMADVLERAIRRVEHPIRANTAGPRCSRALRSSGSVSTTSPATCVSWQTYTPDP